MRINSSPKELKTTVVSDFHRALQAFKHKNMQIQ